jgi:putative ABC transport system permease protein
MADLRHDYRTTLVLILTVAAIIAPLLLLLGLKNGVITSLRQELLNDPRNLEIVVYGAQELDLDWFETTARRPDVGFLVPKTRSINATIDLLNPQRRIFQAIEMVPTAPGDPLLPDGLPVPGNARQILVTETLANKLGATAGDEIIGVLRRRDGGKRENNQIPLRLIGIIPETSVSRDAAFTHLDLLVGSEDYRDGLRGPLTEQDLRTPIATERSRFANARVYATDLEGVATLAQAMRRHGIEIRTQAEKIETVQALDRILSFVLRVVSLIGTTGCALALGGALWVNVDRKRRDLALLRLFGFPNNGVALVPLTQSAVIAAAGFSLAFVAYSGGAVAFNRILGANLGDSGYACRLDAPELLAAAGAALAVALLAATAAAWRAGRIDPSECLREL